jgi:hypothetical protein
VPFVNENPDTSKLQVLASTK